MGSPVTPSDIQSLIPDPTSSKCSGFTKALLQLPVKIYQFINWMLDSDGNLTDAFKALISDATIKPGDLIFSASPLDTNGRLLCNGQAVSRTTYATLYGKIGISYGSGDGSTTFNLPDYRDKFPRGVNAGSVGATGGADTVTLGLTNIPPHSHTVLLRDGGAPNGAEDYAQWENADPDTEDATAETSETGGSGSPKAAQPFDIIPSYVSCYVYIKT